MVQMSGSRRPQGRACLAVALVGAAMLVLPPGVSAQTALTCQTVAADVQGEQPTGLPMVGENQYSMEGRTSEQVIQQWATIQDPDPEACRLVKAVQHNLVTENAYARQQCPDVLPALERQAEFARNETTILCRGRR